MREVKTAWRLWWEWSPERVENWLEEMAREGWALFQVDFASLRFRFTRGEAGRIRYCADYQEKADDNYIKLLKDDGWELVWTGTFGWYIWRKPYSGERPSLYTDRATIIHKNKRSLGVTISILFFLMASILSSVLLFDPVFNESGRMVVRLVSLIIMVIIYVYIIVQLFRYNRKLGRERIKE